MAIPNRFSAILLYCNSQGPLNGGASRSGLVLPFFVFFCPFWDFPDFSGICPICLGMVRGFFPIRPVSLFRPIKSTYEEQSLKGPRHNLDLSWEKGETPRFSFSQNSTLFCFLMRNFWRFRAHDAGNCAIRDSRFCVAKRCTSYCKQECSHCKQRSPPNNCKREASNYQQKRYIQ